MHDLDETPRPTRRVYMQMALKPHDKELIRQLARSQQRSMTGFLMRLVRLEKQRMAEQSSAEASE